MTPAFKQEFIIFLQELSENPFNNETPDNAATLLGNLLYNESLRGPLHLRVMATDLNEQELFHYLEDTCWFSRKTEQERNILRGKLTGAIIQAKLAAQRASNTDEEIAKLNAFFSESKNSIIQEIVRPVQSDKLTLRQVALLHVYKNKIIPKAADAIAKNYGHQSGAKIYSHYLTVSQRAGRIGEDIVGQRLAPMIKDIKRVVPRLSGTAQQQAESELKTLEARK